MEEQQTALVRHKPDKGGCPSSWQRYVVLSLCLGHAEGSCGTAVSLGGCIATLFDGAELLFVLHHVVLEGEEQALGVLGCENLAAVDTCLGDTGEGSNEIDDELLVAVIDDGKVAVGAVGNLGGEFNLQLLLLGLFLFFHDVKNV